MNTDRHRYKEEFKNNLSVKICVYLWLQISFLAFSSAAVEVFADDEDSKLAIPFKSIPAKDRDMLQKIINKENLFLKWRDEDIEKNDGLFKYDDGHGFTGGLKILYKKDREKIYQGNYIYTTGVGVPVRLSGEWVLILKYEDKNELLEIDIDLYLTQGDEGVGRIAKDLPFILKSIMAEKVDSYISSVRELSELIHSDPEDAYDRLKESGEIKDRDLREFKKIILNNNR